MSQIVTVPNAVLREVSKPVTSLDKKTLEVIEDMKKALLSAKKPQGVGLAAIQIGIPLRIFLSKPSSKSPISIFINPEIIKFSQRMQTSKDSDGVLEGCLSIPEHYAPISRSMSVTVKYQKPELAISNWQLAIETAVFTGFPAHVIQHEMDHLNGILFIDRCLEQNTKLYKVDGKNWQEVDI